MRPGKLLFAHKYEEFAAYCEAELEKDPDNSGLIADHASAMQCLGRLEEALAEYQRANALYDKRTKSEPWLEKIGTLQWLLGERDEAIRTFTRGVDGILDGSIEFGDAAGGASHGLLLWYAGVTARDDAAKLHALRYLRRLSRQFLIKSWPGPIALFALGDKTWDVVLAELGKTTDLDEQIERAGTDLLMRRRLTQALFYRGVRKRSEGLDDDCHAAMVQCASLENPILEVEWYLARAEAEQARQ